MSVLIKKIHQNSKFVIISQVVTRASGIIAVYILAKFLPVEDYGVYNFIIGSLLVFSFLTNFGYGSSLQRFLPEYAKLNNIKLIINTLVFGQVFRAILGLIFCALVIFFFPLYSSFFKIENYYTEYVLFCIASFFFFQIEFLLISFGATFHHKFSTISQMCFLSLRVLLIFVFLYLGFGLTYVFIAEIVSYCIGFLILEYFFLSAYKISIRDLRNISFKNLEWKRIIWFSGFSSLTIPGNFLFSYSMDFFVIASLSNQFELGIYSLASRVSQATFNIMPQNFFQTIIRPVFFQKYYSDTDKGKSINFMFQFLLKFLSITNFGILVIALAISNDLFDLLFGNKYVGSEVLFNVIIFFGIFKVLELPSDLVLQTLEKVHTKIFIQLSAVYNLVAAIVLMKHYGILGVAIATSTAQALKSITLFILARYYTKIQFPISPILKVLINSFLTFLLVKGTILMINIKGSFIFAGLLGIIFYLIISYLFNSLTNEDKILINKLLKNNFFKIV